jgi:hypothetical protein
MRLGQLEEVPSPVEKHPVHVMVQTPSGDLDVCFDLVRRPSGGVF